MMKKDTFLSAKDVRLIDIVNKLPSIKRIALMTSTNQLDNPKIVNVATFKKSELYDFYKLDKVKYISPEVQWGDSSDVHLPYLLVVMG